MGTRFQGKSGGIRAVFYYYVKGSAIYLLDAYPKNEKENLTNAEKTSLKKLAKAIGRSVSIRRPEEHASLAPRSSRA